MLTERFFNTSIEIMATMCILSLNACASLGLASVQAGAAIGAVGAAAATQNHEDGPTDTEVRGNYENGFWFDRDLFFVWVTAYSSDEAERVARLTATDSCLKREKPLKVMYTKDWQERRLFIPVKIDRFSYEIRFRCVADLEAPE